MLSETFSFLVNSRFLLYHQNFEKSTPITNFLRTLYSASFIFYQISIHNTDWVTPVIIAVQIIFPLTLVCVTAFQKNIILRIKTKTGWRVMAFLFYISFRSKPAQNKKKYIVRHVCPTAQQHHFFQTYGIALRFFLKFSKDLCNTSPQERTICEKISGK